MLPHQFRQLMELLRDSSEARRADLGTLQEVIENQVRATRDQTESEGEQSKRAAEMVSRAIGSADDDKCDDRTYREKNYRVQKILAFVAFLTFLAAAVAAVGAIVYAHIAAKQLDAMQVQTLISAQGQLQAGMDAVEQSIVTAQQLHIAQQQAQAAFSSSESARQALWASEGANVYTDPPEFNTGPHQGRIPVINNGHMASGAAQITVHVVTLEVDPKTGGNKPLEYHWGTKRVDSVPLGPNYTVWLNLPQLTGLGLIDGTRMVLLGGSIDYSIGIGGAPKRSWHFCYRTQANPGHPGYPYDSTSCDPVVIESWKMGAGYPAHQEPLSEQAPFPQH